MLSGGGKQAWRVRQQFKAILPMVELILKGLKAEKGLEGALRAAIWDDGDAVGAWEGKNLSAVVFPTAEVLKQVCGTNACVQLLG